ncbi:hypothetical protein Tco_1461114, partial [Tanacetum coccineum]
NHYFSCSSTRFDIQVKKQFHRCVIVGRGFPICRVSIKGSVIEEVLKERNIACDAICFGDPADNKQELFLTLIAFNLLHVPPGSSSVHDVLLRQVFVENSIINNHHGGDTTQRARAEA